MVETGLSKTRSGRSHVIKSVDNMVEVWQEWHHLVHSASCWCRLKLVMSLSNKNVDGILPSTHAHWHVWCLSARPAFIIPHLVPMHWQCWCLSAISMLIVPYLVPMHIETGDVSQQFRRWLYPTSCPCILTVLRFLIVGFTSPGIHAHWQCWCL